MIQMIARTLLPASLRAHLLIVCTALFVAGLVIFWVLPGFSRAWILAAVLISAHIGLFGIFGIVVFKRVMNRNSR